MVIEHVAGVAQHEQVAEALVEVEFGRDARVGAREDNRKRRLAFFEGVAALRGLVGVGDISTDEARVAGGQTGEGFVGGNGSFGEESRDGGESAEENYAEQSGLAGGWVNHGNRRWNRFG